MAELWQFFSFLFSSIIQAFVISDINLFYVLGGALVVGCLLSIVFHNKG